MLSNGLSWEVDVQILTQDNAVSSRNLKIVEESDENRIGILRSNCKSGSARMGRRWDRKGQDRAPLELGGCRNCSAGLYCVVGALFSLAMIATLYDVQRSRPVIPTEATLPYLDIRSGPGPQCILACSMVHDST